MKLVEGLYETPITEGLEAELRAIVDAAKREALTAESAPPVFARLLHDAAMRALRNLPEKERLAEQVRLTNRVLQLFAETAKESGIARDEALHMPAEMLTGFRTTDSGGLGTNKDVARPTLGLRQSALFVNAPGDLRVGHEVPLELASADRVDLLIAFVKWSGLRLLRDHLAEFLARRPNGLRVLTTTYLGASEADAVEALLEMGAKVKVSYATAGTRLHAKAWLFHRASEFHTAIIGSSNLSATALLDGCEWNVRVSAVDNDAILRKFSAVFEQYWQEDEYEAYDRDRFTQQTRRRDPGRDALANVVSLRAKPHQQDVLDKLTVERDHKHTRNLVVAATGTGKTVIAALDYARLCKERGDLSLLFVAHREPILRQSLATFQIAMKNGNFGELLVGADRPVTGRHVFASIQSFHPKRLATLKRNAFDMVIVDEFHHADGDYYQALLDNLEPQFLLGLTATPERADGKSVLHWFDHRVAAEIRLWSALDLGLVSPFQYFGIHDQTDLSAVDFRGGRYDVAMLDKLYTGDHQRAKKVLTALHEHVHDLTNMRALGFCVSIKHAEFMAAWFAKHNVKAVAISGETPIPERAAALQRLRGGDVQIVFSRDLLNEGIDVPAVNTVLFLRPTESATVFLQQLGRGLRLEDDKTCLTVLDFIGNANRKFRFVDRYRAILGGTRASVGRSVKDGFPFLPAGCEIKLDRESQRAIMDNIRASVIGATTGLVDDLRALGDVSLSRFLEECNLELEDLYRNGRCLTNLKRAAGVTTGPQLDTEVVSAFERMLYIDDDDRLSRWQAMLAGDDPFTVDANNPFLLMLLAVLGMRDSIIDESAFRTAPKAKSKPKTGANKKKTPKKDDVFARSLLAELWKTPDLLGELRELFALLADRLRRASHPLPGLPFRVHATYSRDEISAGLRKLTPRGTILRTQGGVYNVNAVRTDILYVTLEKDPDHFTPTTLYNDYPKSQTLFHWESQSVTRADSRTGLRYRALGDQPWQILLFVRRARKDARGVTSPYLLLGPVRYVEHESEKPMKIDWELERPMPPAFFNEVKLAAG